jgi:hypothetical protein
MNLLQRSHKLTGDDLALGEPGIMVKIVRDISFTADAFPTAILPMHESGIRYTGIPNEALDGKI